MRKNIQDIAPLLADHFIDVDDTLWVDNTNLLKKSKQSLGRYYDYLGKLHDSWIIKTTITPQHFILNLNDFTTHVFADALISKKGFKVNEDDLVFRIDLDFQISNITFNTVDKDGFIDEIKPTKLDEYLYEEVISVADEVTKIGVVGWTNGRGRKPGQHILLFIDVENVAVSEHQALDWKKVFGDNYDKYYNKFEAELLNGRFLSDQSLWEKLIDEIDEGIG